MVIVVGNGHGETSSNPERDRTLGEKKKFQVYRNIVRWKKIKKEYLRTKNLLETKLYSRNFIKGIKAGAIHLVRYSGPF